MVRPPFELSLSHISHERPKPVTSPIEFKQLVAYRTDLNQFVSISLHSAVINIGRSPLMQTKNKSNGSCCTKASTCLRFQKRQR